MKTSIGRGTPLRRCSPTDATATTSLGEAGAAGAEIDGAGFGEGGEPAGVDRQAVCFWRQVGRRGRDADDISGMDADAGGDAAAERVHAPLQLEGGLAARNGAAEPLDAVAHGRQIVAEALHRLLEVHLGHELGGTDEVGEQDSAEAQVGAGGVSRLELRRARQTLAVGAAEQRAAGPEMTAKGTEQG